MQIWYPDNIINIYKAILNVMCSFQSGMIQCNLKVADEIIKIFYVARSVVRTVDDARTHHMFHGVPVNTTCDSWGLCLQANTVILTDLWMKEKA